MYKLGESASGTMDLVTSGFIRWMLRPPPPPEGVPAARMIGAYTKLMLNAFALFSKAGFGRLGMHTYFAAGY
ncbi:hypothetical protein GCM10011339_45540 [Echinicola rosea]|uniref:Uncharacterized protein n=1 Tax=Echinicola rosea TaxID=1807691 RepID=A0ABQ1VDT8_9BACT|nr:hypothetical protein GCM10011339_45540 [Echinicola rosea]